jgi:hypothetical protein
LGGAGLDFLERDEGAMVGALGGIDAALEEVEGVAVAFVGLGDLESLGLAEETVDVESKEIRFEGAVAALQPLGGDEGVDQGAHFGSGGLVAVVVFGGEKFEGRGVFAGDDLGFGVNAGFQGVEANRGLALGRARTGGFLRVEAIGLDLFARRHRIDGVPAALTFRVASREVISGYGWSVNY